MEIHNYDGEKHIPDLSIGKEIHNYDAEIHIIREKEPHGGVEIHNGEVANLKNSLTLTVQEIHNKVGKSPSPECFAGRGIHNGVSNSPYAIFCG